MYSYFKDFATVKRNVLLNNKSTYQPTGVTTYWFLKPVSSADVLDQERFWQDFNFHTYDYVDIKTSDILVINWDNYTVKWVWVSQWFIVKYRKILLSKSK